MHNCTIAQCTNLVCVVIRAIYQCDKWLLLKNKILLFSEKWVRYGSPNCV